MSSRRPAARPGNRSGARATPPRSRARDARGAAPTGPTGPAGTDASGSRGARSGRTVRSADAATVGSRPSAPSARSARSAGEAAAPRHTILRLGGADGITVPARVLVLVLAVLFACIVTFPSLRGYLHQQAEYDAVVDEIASAKATSTALENELQQWQDESYVKEQARERLSYVMPGETTYVVVGAQPYEDSSAAGSQGSAAADSGPWYETLRESARLAGTSGEVLQDPAQQGWSTAVPTVPTPTAAPTDLTSYSRTLGQP